MAEDGKVSEDQRRFKKFYICTRCKKTFIKPRTKCIDCESRVEISDIDSQELESDIISEKCMDYQNRVGMDDINNQELDNNIIILEKQSRQKFYKKLQNAVYYFVFIFLVIFSLAIVQGGGIVSSFFLISACLLVFPPIHPFILKVKIFGDSSLIRWISASILMFFFGAFMSISNLEADKNKQKIAQFATLKNELKINKLSLIKYAEENLKNGESELAVARLEKYLVVGDADIDKIYQSAKSQIIEKSALQAYTDAKLLQSSDTLKAYDRLLPFIAKTNNTEIKDFFADLTEQARPLLEDREKTKLYLNNHTSISLEVFKDDFNETINSDSYATISNEKISSYSLFSESPKYNTKSYSYDFPNNTQLMASVDNRNNKITAFSIISTPPMYKDEEDMLAESSKSIRIMKVSSFIFQKNDGNISLSESDKLISKMLKDALSNANKEIEEKLGSFTYSMMYDYNRGRYLLIIKKA